MRHEPIHDRILIRPDPPQDMVAGLKLFGADVQEQSRGTVILVGEGVPLHNIHLNITADASLEVVEKIKEVVELIERGRRMRVSPGDKVIYGKFAGTKITYNGEPHIIIRESDVFFRETDD